MRIIHVAGGDLYGGIERMLSTFAATKTEGLQQHFAVSSTGRLYRELLDVTPHVVALPRARASRPLRVLAARREFSRMLANLKPDAAIFHGSWTHAMFAPVGREHAPVVAFWQHAPLVTPGWPDRLASWTRPDVLIANSRYTSSAPAFSGLTPRVVHCPVQAIEPLSPSDRAVGRVQLGARDTDVVVLMAARLEAWKGHSVLIDAARRLNSAAVKFWIAGGVQRPSEQDYLNQLQREVATVPGSSVALLGQRDDVQRLMGMADVYCQPNSAPEPFGLAIAEAMSAGLPCVVSRSGGAMELVNDECGILTAPGDPAAVAGALETLCADPARRKLMGAAGKLRAQVLTAPHARGAELADALFQNHPRGFRLQAEVSSHG